MDETPIYLNIYVSTIVKTIGPRKVNIRYKDKKTVIITILISGEKLAHLLIFKAKEQENIEKKVA